MDEPGPYSGGPQNQPQNQPQPEARFPVSGEQDGDFQPRFQQREQREFQPRPPREQREFQPRDQQPRENREFQPRQPREQRDYQPRDRDNAPREQRDFQPRDREQRPRESPRAGRPAAPRGTRVPAARRRAASRRYNRQDRFPRRNRPDRDQPRPLSTGRIRQGRISRGRNSSRGRIAQARCPSPGKRSPGKPASPTSAPVEAVETSLPAFITAPVRTPVIEPEPAAAAPTAAEGDAFPSVPAAAARPGRTRRPTRLSPTTPPPENNRPPPVCNRKRKGGHTPSLFCYTSRASRPAGPPFGVIALPAPPFTSLPSSRPERSGEPGSSAGCASIPGRARDDGERGGAVEGPASFHCNPSNSLPSSRPQLSGEPDPKCRPAARPRGPKCRVRHVPGNPKCRSAARPRNPGAERKGVRGPAQDSARSALPSCLKAVTSRCAALVVLDPGQGSAALHISGNVRRGRTSGAWRRIFHPHMSSRP